MNPPHPPSYQPHLLDGEFLLSIQPVGDAQGVINSAPVQFGQKLPEVAAKHSALVIQRLGLAKKQNGVFVRKVRPEASGHFALPRLEEHPWETRSGNPTGNTEFAVLHFLSAFCPLFLPPPPPVCL